MFLSSLLTSENITFMWVSQQQHLSEKKINTDSLPRCFSLTCSIFARMALDKIAQKKISYLELVNNN